MKPLLVAPLLLSTLLSLPACLDGDVDLEGDDLGEGASAVVGGTIEPDYKHPWVVSLNGCRGVLIDPRWVLTAAHCVDAGTFGGNVTASRTDASGQVRTQSRKVSLSTGVIKHPQYVGGGGFSSPKNDIALLRLDQPFTIDPTVQTVALPKAPRVVGRIGAIAAGSHLQNNPPGTYAVMRTDIPSTPPPFCAPPDGAFCVVSTSAALCPGDSGSGFVTIENGRATVTGIASYARASSCQTVDHNDYAGLTDVYTYRGWVLETMKTTEAALAGNTRVRWAGRASRGVLGLGCVNPFGTMYAPLEVLGVQLGATCEAGQTQSIVCSMSSSQTQPLPLAITAFTMRTIASNGTSTVQALPHGKTFASYYGTTPAGVTREFTCTVGLADVVAPPVVGGVLSP